MRLLDKLEYLSKGVKPDMFEAPVTTLVVTAQLATPYIPTDTSGRLHLDSILAYAFFQWLPFPVPYQEVAVAPLPLELLWVSKDGLPLWACTDLLPQGEVLRDREYWHKRYPSDRVEFGKKINANTAAGRYKEYRIPLQTIHCAELKAICIGSKGWLEQLLVHATHVGKKNTQGFGRVSKWSVEQINKPISEVKSTLLLERPVPIDYPKLEPGTYLPRVGWTPPYWYAPWHLPCRVPHP